MVIQPNTARVAFALSLVLALGTSAVRAEGEDMHAHMHHGGGAVTQMTLNAGQKWGTDESLRKGMVNAQGPQEVKRITKNDAAFAKQLVRKP